MEARWTARFIVASCERAVIARDGGMCCEHAPIVIRVTTVDRRLARLVVFGAIVRRNDHNANGLWFVANGSGIGLWFVVNSSGIITFRIVTSAEAETE